MLLFAPWLDTSKVRSGRYRPKFKIWFWVFVLDFSGSMKGKYQSLIAGVNNGLAKLRPTDRFRIVLFNNGCLYLAS